MLSTQPYPDQRRNELLRLFLLARRQGNRATDYGHPTLGGSVGGNSGVGGGSGGGGSLGVGGGGTGGGSGGGGGGVVTPPATSGTAFLPLLFGQNYG